MLSKEKIEKMNLYGLRRLAVQKMSWNNARSMTVPKLREWAAKHAKDLKEPEANGHKSTTSSTRTTARGRRRRTTIGGAQAQHTTGTPTNTAEQYPMEIAFRFDPGRTDMRRALKQFANVVA